MSAAQHNLHQNTQKLQHLVREYQLSLTKVAEISNRSVSCVRNWHSGKYRTIPADTLSLLEIRLQDMRGKGLL